MKLTVRYFNVFLALASSRRLSASLQNVTRSGRKKEWCRATHCPQPPYLHLRLPHQTCRSHWLTSLGTSLST